MPWRDISNDPNSAAVLARRQEIFDAAVAPPITDRHERIVELCRDRDVLDIGCVDHRASRQGRPGWLHGPIAQAARRCVGVDIEPDGVAAMVANGYEAIVHDICADPAPLLEMGRFDTVVAGEVIEHLAAPQSLFEFAAAVLEPGGILVLSTPNPYYPRRITAGLRGQLWENADHVTYAFPAGIIEMGERTGLTLIESRTVLRNGIGAGRQARRAAVRLKRRIIGPRPAPGSNSDGMLAARPFNSLSELVIAALASRSHCTPLRTWYLLSPLLLNNYPRATRQPH